MNEETLFELACKTPQAERAALLDQHCAGNPALRARVEALLQADAQTLGYRPDPLGTKSYHQPIGEAGQVVAGKYSLVEVIGEGGMGSVWRAKQTEPVKRFVAVKLIKAGMDSKVVLARFEAERQALAVMDHPNIAKILDGGLHENRPYFVMELVKGVPITEYCDARKLTPQQRLELFVPVCQAIQHAHQKGIIHRDIKPSNVMVALYDDKPVVKVIDFGVAKATGGTLTEQTIDTGFGGVVGTPQYMSPEQASLNNLDIDTRSDVYALGVLLYELLTGSTPVDRKSLGQAALLEVLRIVREVETPSPSAKLSSIDTLPSVAANRGTEPAKLSKLMKGELDWVVLKALEKDRTRRYDSANGLARDIQRYLADEVVEARPPSRGYRLRKFMRKNKGPVAAVGLILFTLLAGVVGTGFGLAQAESRRIEADKAREREAERAEEANRAAIEAQKARGDEATQRERAEKAYGRTIDVLDTMVSGVTGNSLETQRELSAEQRKFLANMSHYYQEFATSEQRDEKSRTRVANSLFRLAHIEYRLGRHKEATAAYVKACGEYATLAADYSTVTAYRKQLASTQHGLGFMLRITGKRADAEAPFRQSILIYERLAKENPETLDYQAFIGHGRNNLGLVLVELTRATEAEAEYRKALVILEKLVQIAPEHIGGRQELAWTHNCLGDLLWSSGKRVEAEKHLRESLSHREKLVSKFPTFPPYRQEYARSLDGIGTLELSQGKHAEAETRLRLSLAIHQKLVAEYPGVPEYRFGLAQHFINVGIVKKESGNRKEAEHLFRQAVDLLEKLLAEFPSVPHYRQNLELANQQFAGLIPNVATSTLGEEHYRQEIEKNLRLSNDAADTTSHLVALANSHIGLAYALSKKGQSVEAEGQFQKALSVAEKLVTLSPADKQHRQRLATNLMELANVQMGTRKTKEADANYRRAIVIQEKLVADSPGVAAYRQELARSLTDLGRVVIDLGKQEESESLSRKALAVLNKLVEDYPTEPYYQHQSAWTIYNLADRLSALGKKIEAEVHYRNAIALNEKLVAKHPSVPTYRHDLCSCHKHLADLLKGVDKREEAEKHYRLSLIGLDKLTTDYPNNPYYRSDTDYCHFAFARMLSDVVAEATTEEQYHSTLAIMEKRIAEVPGHNIYRRMTATAHNARGLRLSDQGKRAEAEAEYHRGIAILEKLIAEQPTVTENRVNFGGMCCNLGNTLSGTKEAGSLPWYNKAVQTLSAVLEQNSGNSDAVPFLRINLRNSYWGRARARDKLKQYAEAVTDWDKSVELSPKEEQPTHRAGRASSRLRAGQVAEAVAEVAELTKTPNWNAGQWYNFACIYAVASGKVVDNKTEYADGAIELLHKSVKAGYKDAAHMKKDTDLDPLREREDFKKLLAELEKAAVKPLEKK